MKLKDLLLIPAVAFSGALHGQDVYRYTGSDQQDLLTVANHIMDVRNEKLWQHLPTKSGDTVEVCPENTYAIVWDDREYLLANLVQYTCAEDNDTTSRFEYLGRLQTFFRDVDLSRVAVKQDDLHDRTYAGSTPEDPVATVVFQETF